MAPFLRDRYGLSLGETGVLISGSLAGSVLSLFPWGLATDRFGERAVLVVGVGGCGAALVGASRVHTFLPLLLLLMVAGFAGASVQSASGRAVMAWFPERQRGTALGIRQTAIPISGFAASLALPPLVHRGGVGLGFATLGGACLVAAGVGGLALRERAGPAASGEEQRVSLLRDSRLWRVSIASGLILAPQNCVLGFAVLFLHDHRGLSPGDAAAVLAVVQALAVAGRVGAGRWSDVVGSRLQPLRVIALVVAVLVALTATLVDAPLLVLLPILIAAGVLAMSWNSLSFAAAVEYAGYRRSGAAIGLQQSILNGSGSLYPPLFGVLVAATTWRWGFLAVALFPLAGWRVLRALPG
jgi:sugar phosphate permease